MPEVMHGYKIGTYLDRLLGYFKMLLVNSSEKLPMIGFNPIEYCFLKCTVV